MGLSAVERETVINFNCGEKEASIYTAEPSVWRKIEKWDDFKHLRTDHLHDKPVSKEFIFPKSLIRFTKRGIIIAPPKKVSEKQREARKENIKIARSSSKTL